MDAVPEPTPVTSPVADTVATAPSLVRQVIGRSFSVSWEASKAVATSRTVSPVKSVATAGSTDTDATGEGGVVVEWQATNAARTMVPRSCFMVPSLVSNATAGLPRPARVSIHGTHPGRELQLSTPIRLDPRDPRAAREDLREHDGRTVRRPSRLGPVLPAGQQPHRIGPIRVHHDDAVRQIVHGESRAVG